MPNYYIEVSRPAFPARGIHYRVLSAREYTGVDVLSPTLTALLQVEHAGSKKEAVAVALEYAAGKPVTVRRILPRDEKRG